MLVTPSTMRRFDGVQLMIILFCVIEERRPCAIDAFANPEKPVACLSIGPPSSIQRCAPRQARIRAIKWHLVDDHFPKPRNRGQTRALNSSPCLPSWESISKSGEHLRRTRLWEPSLGAVALGA